ncbi:hypothetical protein [Mycobacterium paragordonae]|uniref:Uncharacterized protein n=1 Tax=Mycobacterium paragordonae TaxID=1389713 RepID=A0AAJ1S8N0_9MYCO|nr:hypothetical protein [Mycobacterium paragordonae]MBI2699709.1 hypothetical protein [Mycobacterium sp.]MDP7739245.1 hypothetical protein [Mycobacterium paragordonae]TDL04026.1 hypothetical protein EUA05_22485 [Mycobacterium paragordonae]
MHSITITQFTDDDDDVITTAETDPAAISVSVRTTGAIVDVDADVDRLRPLGADGLKELFVTCAQAAFAHRYDPLLDEQH